MLGVTRVSAKLDASTVAKLVTWSTTPAAFNLLLRRDAAEDEGFRFMVPLTWRH
jgi:hypothetical protein